MNSPIKVFSNWVINGKDEGMEKGHSQSVKNMLDYSIKEQPLAALFLTYVSGYRHIE